MTQATLYSSRGEYQQGLPGGLELSQQVARLAIEVVSTAAVGVAKELGGLLLGRELTQEPQRSFTLQDGEAHSRGAAALAAIKQTIR